MCIQNLDTKTPVDVWIVIDCEGDFEKCDTQEIAAAKAVYNDLRWPAFSPHRVVHLIEAEDTAPPRNKS